MHAPNLVGVYGCYRVRATSLLPELPLSLVITPITTTHTVSSQLPSPLLLVYSFIPWLPICNVRLCYSIITIISIKRRTLMQHHYVRVRTRMLSVFWVQVFFCPVLFITLLTVKSSEIFAHNHIIIVPSVIDTQFQV